MSEQTTGGVEEQHRLLLECVTDYAIFTLDSAGKVNSWNAGARRILGYHEKEVLGQPFSLFFTPEDIAAGEYDKELRTASEAGQASDERWQVRKGGSRFWASGITTALRDEMNNLLGFAKVLRDRTEQHNAREALQASERRNRILLENAWDGITLIAPDGTILETSPVTFRGLGYSSEEYIGRKGFDLLHVDDAPAVGSLLVQVLRQPGQKVTAQYRLRHKDGSWRWVEAIATNLLEEPGVRAIVVNHRDITERKEADRRKDEWIAMLAHELRGPLGPVSNATQVLLRKQPEDPELQQAGEVIARQTQHLARLVDGLLEVTRLLRGEIRLQKGLLDLGLLVRTTAEDHRSALEQAGMKVDLEMPKAPVWVAGDATRLSQVVGNLLDNTVKFKDGGDRVEIHLRADVRHNQAVLVVRDRGIGIEPELLPVLFDVFAQADRSLNRQKGGLGLGLSVCKGLIELHGGEVHAASLGTGKGAEFTVLLPLEREPSALAIVSAPLSAVTERLRILIVEDNKDSADSLRLLLTLMGYEVRVAYTGPDGVRMATEWVPDVIVSDIGLPGLDGYGVASQLRRHPATAHVRMIAVTGYGGEENRQRALQSGFDHHLTKPADPFQLQELLTGRE